MSKTTPLGNPLSGGARVKENVRSTSELTKIPLTKSISPLRDSKGRNPITQRSETSLPNAKEIKKSRSC